jgi:soluble lytic murein transglycosylase
MEWRTEAIREWNWGMRGLDDQQLLAAAELASAQWLVRPRHLFCRAHG